jgi:glucans biosynthesis protein
VRPSRRRVLQGAGAAALVGVSGLPATLPAHAEPALGTVTPFSRPWLVERARTLARSPYVAPDVAALPAEVADLSYDALRAIRYRPEEALWRSADLPFEAQFFHLGSYYDKPVHIDEAYRSEAREILYRPELFDLGPNVFAEPLPADLGFAGFRLHYPLNTPNYRDELAAFLGASYFRGLGRGCIYGLSARGLAIDTATDHGEEFPWFRAFWLERPEPDATEIRVHGLLDSPGVAGAYSLTIRPGDITVMEVETTLFVRHQIEKFGIAPLTSMFLFGPADNRGFDDFRPQIHDSDGLSLWTGAGEWIWRPLRNPRLLLVSSFVDENPRGFGLMQRERNFSSYQDLEAHYQSRPSLWVEPMSGWGRGVVQLIEIPSNSEIHDNIVAFWLPEEPVVGGAEWNLTYRLHWGLEAPFRSDRARVVGTRTGTGGVAGGETLENRKFVIDFRGDSLDGLPADAEVETVVTVSSGEVLFPVAQRNPEIAGWRAFFDLKPADEGPVDLRCFLRRGSDALTETWSFQWTPY